MIKAWGLTNRGSKQANFAVLRETNAPASLSELGFITSPTDIQKLCCSGPRQEIAVAHFDALKRHFGYA
jgi:N-acetylmuramoyl-L-alanine amidase